VARQTRSERRARRAAQAESRASVDRAPQQRAPQPARAPAEAAKPASDGQVLDSILTLFDPNATPPLSMTAFDRAYLQMMITHHNGSMQMCRDEQTNGLSTEAKAMSETMIKTLTAQVNSLQKFASM